MAIGIEILGLALIGLGLAFFWAGTVGMLRFPDVFCRLHALTKADNLGLGLTALGTALLAGSWAAAVKLALIWLVVALASASGGHLIARHALRARTGDREA
jgi:multicomponent Na+:H+ antiporter subunit G